MDEKLFLKKSYTSFSKPCLKYFNFLKLEFGFGFEGIIIAHESIASYVKNNVYVNIVFEIPSCPILYIKKMKGKRIKETKIFKPKMKETSNFIKEFNKIRDDVDFEIWIEYLKTGSLDNVFDKVLFQLAKEIKPKIPNLLDGDFDVIKN